MSDFLALIENYDLAKTDASAVFQGDGLGIRGYARARANGDPAAKREYNRGLREARDLIREVMTGSRFAWAKFQEALTTSDFPLLFGDIIDRALWANYNEWPVTYPNYCKVETVRDFRTVNRFVMNGAEAVLPAVAQGAEYTERRITEARYQYSVAKYGAGMPFSWESQQNDDLDALKDIPERFGRAARRSEEKFATDLFASTSGGDTTFFSNTNKNIVNTTNGAATNNPALSRTALNDAINVLSKQVDTDGEPIMVEGVQLVVPPSLKITANDVLNTVEYRSAEGSNLRIIKGNGLGGTFTLSVNPYLPIITSVANGSTAWYLFANPNQGRPAVVFGRLMGHEGPEIFYKEPDQRRIGGAQAGLLDGDFETDTLRYKVRIVFGGVLGDPKMAVTSNGSGT